MKAILIFDNINDLLFSKWDDDFLECIKNFNEGTDDSLTDSHNVSQLLSPIITSQRVMAAQFGNTYSSMQCKDKTTIVFDEWLDHVFLIISKECVDEAHRELLDCKTFVQHICGQNINLLQSSVYKNWLSVLLESRGKGDSVPGASGVIGECGATAAALSALKAVSKDIKSTHSHLHLMLYVGDKLLALYSSRGCEDLTPSDLILMSIECIAAQEYWNSNEDNDEENNIQMPWLSAGNGGVVYTCAGAAGVPSAPHAMYLAPLAQRIVFVILVDMDLRDVGIPMQMSSQILSNLSRLLLQRNMDMLSNTLDALEVALKKTSESLRKSKNISGGGGAGARLAHSMGELRRAYGVSPLASDTAAAALHTALQAALQLLPTQPPHIDTTNALRALKTSLAPYIDFLRVKAMRFFSLGSGEGESGSLTLHKYVEEFPGLVHFVYVDRCTGRFLAPDIADCADMVTPEAVRAVVSRALSTLREGYCAASWRRGALHACAVQWWERRSQPVSPARPPHVAAVRALPPPGDILNAFHRQLVEMAFPKDSEGVCVKELVCIHLGLVPAATAVQQARRLAHAVHEIGAARAPAADLL